MISDIVRVDPPASRTAEGRIQFQVHRHAVAAGRAAALPAVDSRHHQDGWAPPADDGGAPILYYMVREERSGTGQRCDTNECVFRKLKNGGNYRFRVQAVNRVGGSEWSGLSRTARADTRPVGCRTSG